MSPESADLAIELEKLKANFELNIEFLKLRTKMLKVEYDALVDEGFTSDQAIEILKSKD